MNTNTPNKHFGFSLTLVAAALLVGCGGGGGKPPAAAPGTDAVNQLAGVVAGAAEQGVQTGQQTPGTQQAGGDGSGNGEQSTGPDGGTTDKQQPGPDGGNTGKQPPQSLGGKANAQTRPDDKAAKSHPIRAEFGVNLQGKAVAAVLPLATANRLYPKQVPPPVAVPLANALMQVVVHDPEYAARLALANSRLKGVASLPGQKSSVEFFRQFYSDYADGAANFEESQRNMLDVLGRLIPFQYQPNDRRNVVTELRDALRGRTGLNLPFMALGDFTGDGSHSGTTGPVLAREVKSMQQKLEGIAPDAKIVIDGREPAPGTQQVKAVTRAFVLADAVPFTGLPEHNKIESFVVRDGRANYVTFINKPADDGTPRWTMAANGQVTPLQVGASAEKRVAIVEEAVYQYVSFVADYAPLPGVVMVVYRL